MKVWKATFLFCFLISEALAYGATQPATEDFDAFRCGAQLHEASEPTRNLEFEKLQRSFLKNPLLLYSEPLSPKAGDGGAFYSSNEYDFFKAPLISMEADLVVGVATNAALDVAIRTGAKELVLADWNNGPLIGFENFVRPLGLIAESPSDFLGLLVGLPVPKELQDGPIEMTFRYIDKLLSKRRMSSKYFIEIHKRLMAKSPKINPEQIDAIMNYYQTLLRPKKLVKEQNFGSFGGAFDGFSFLYYINFRARYNPDVLEAIGAKKQDISDPFFSFVSSPQAFQRFQNLMDGHTHYIQANILRPTLWPHLKRFADLKGAKKVAISLSNVIDTLQEFDALKIVVRAQVYERITKAFFVGYPIQIYETAGKQSWDHRFYHGVIRDPKDIWTLSSAIVAGEDLHTKSAATAAAAAGQSSSH